MKIGSFAALFASGAVAAVILTPVAQAAPPAEPTASSVQSVGNQQIQPSPMRCTTTRVASMCMSPGNAQINDSPPFVDNYPMYGYFPWIL